MVVTEEKINTMKEETRSDTSNSYGCDFNSHHLSNDQFEPAEAEEEDYIRCSRCDQQVVGQMYQCSDCSYYVHKKCVDLQETIANHPLHPHATLALSLVEFDTDCHCYGCPRVFKSSFLGYKCTECTRKLDLKCALSDLDSSIIHEHALEFYYVNEQHQACNRKVHKDEKTNVLIDEVTGRRCAVCELPLEGPVSGCEPCDFWIHKGCRYDFPPSVDNHCLHRSDHNLTFIPQAPFLNRCGACGTLVLRDTFHCEECMFDLHPGCATREPSLWYEVIGNFHHHPLKFFPDPAPFFRCHSCEGYSYKTPIYRCVECDFNLHKACIEFPVTVKHKDHSCLLQHFEGFPVHEKFACSVCEEDVSPNPGAYSCKDCGYGIHLECVRLELAVDQEQQTMVLGKVVKSLSQMPSKFDVNLVYSEAFSRFCELQQDIKAITTHLKFHRKMIKKRVELHGLISKDTRFT